MRRAVFAALILATFCPAVAAAASLSLAVPKVAPDSTVLLTFTLPAEGSVRFDLLDVNGHLLGLQELDGLTAGPHQMPFAQARGLHEGIYFVRLTRIVPPRTPGVISLTKRLLVEK